MVNIKDYEVDKEYLADQVLDMDPDNFDTLEAIFKGQRILMEKYHDIEHHNGALVPDPRTHGRLDDRNLQMRLKDMAYRVVEELSEATNCLKNKPWKNDTQITDKDHFYEEISDAFHFFVEFCITAGIDYEDLFNLYFRKHAVNQFRQRSNY